MAVARQAPPIAKGALGQRGSIGQHVFVVRGRIDIITRFVGVWTRRALWRRSGRRVVPSAQVAKNLFHHPPVLNHRDHAHGVLADWASERVHVPDPEETDRNLLFARPPVLSATRVIAP